MAAAAVVVDSLAPRVVWVATPIQHISSASVAPRLVQVGVGPVVLSSEQVRFAAAHR